MTQLSFDVDWYFIINLVHINTTRCLVYNEGYTYVGTSAHIN